MDPVLDPVLELDPLDVPSVIRLRGSAPDPPADRFPSLFLTSTRTLNLQAAFRENYFPYDFNLIDNIKKRFFVVILMP